MDITMNLNEPLHLKSQSKRRRSDSERTAKKHVKNKRQKSKRAASPTSSYLSMRTDCSIDPPTNFKDGETSPLHSRIKRKRETSPVTSYISLKSDDPMHVSKCNTSDLRERAVSPTPTCFSLKTDWSIDRPIYFKAAETFPLDPRLPKEQHLRCPVCKSMLKDPVSIPCGHNYCNGCINAFWDNCAGEYVCPHCGKASETRPALSINAALAEVVKSMQQESLSPALPPLSYAGPEDVACDFCSERRLKSVKFCLNCDTYLCETHIKQHYTIPGLQKHTLSDVTGDIKTRPSQQGQNSDNSFNSTASGQQHHTDTTQDIIQEMAEGREVSDTSKKLQTRLKRSAKIFRPKTKEKKDNVRSLALMYSTLQQEVSGLKEKLSKIETNTKKEKYKDEEDYGEEYDKEEDSEEEDDDYGEEDEDDVEDYGEEYDGEDNEDYSEKDFDSESDKDSFDDEDGYEVDYDGEEDYDDENSSEKDYDDENNSEVDNYEDNSEVDYDYEDNSEEDSDEDNYDNNY